MTDLRTGEHGHDGIGISTFDPWSGELNRENIWRLYREMRAEGAAIRSDAYGGIWLLSRYADVKNAALDHKNFSSRYGTRIGIRGRMNPPAAPIEYDPPEHRRFRNAMIAPFTAKRIGDFTDLVRRRAESVVKKVVDAGEFDVVHDIAEPMSVGVISDILGFDGDTQVRNRSLALTVLRAGYDTVGAASQAYADFLEHEVNKRMAAPVEGLLGELVGRGQQGEFDVRELVAMARAFALAGHHTTINAVSSMLMRVADEDNRTRWLSDPSDSSTIMGFVEEVLRIDPPIHLEGRWTAAAVEVGGVEIPAESQVALLFASANHDESVFVEPGEFTPSRPVGHLTFGHGVHACLGMALARMEMAELLTVFLARVRRFRLTGAPVDAGMVFGHHMGWEAMPAATE